MYIFELVKPGIGINLEDGEVAWKFHGLLGQLESAFYDANISLNLFELERARVSRFDDFSSEQWEKDAKKKQELTQQVRQELGLSLYEFSDELNLEVDARFKREKWQHGESPQAHLHRIIFLHAKSFLYALDTIDKFLKVMSDESGAPQEIKLLHTQIANDFPNLRGVRNSTQHLEDRARGLGAGRSPQPLNLQPVNNGSILAPQGALILSSLNGTKFGCTMADGHFGEVDVSPESMGKLQSIIQKTFNAFEWNGPKQHLPT
ncbi:hypothetical protein G3W18_08175 [Klebsiella pneumoniae]|uniref:hypothetical protein n=1 Tax=Klebsiella pneumoniae complex TaxID=3390273 RepID=UPI0009BAC71F|nr:MULTISPECIES: hypothetical protein [Klebsiella]HBQ6081274.1 hypothetical protein [Klebsiella pneumoniae subsp. pneumoniae]HCI7046632.1 hypothetical protein [Klebsiella quasipneumoniae subsp. similipneumoniae]MBK5745006.1 hypothetical protein [Klebsiella pneumoniae]MBK5783564.1 hypothetical protein [Klebsiella pneumoniae]MBL4317121.1 hypothetical protein [Klebsiella pneumoniae]